MEKPNPTDSVPCIDIDHLAYVLHKQNWVETHTTPDIRLQSRVNYFAYCAEYEGSGADPLPYEEYLDMFGYTKEPYPCWHVFLYTEYLNVSYICGLLHRCGGLLDCTVDDLFDLYRKDLISRGVDVSKFPSVAEITNETAMSVYRFAMPIGDWCDEANGMCDRFTIESNKPLEDVREAHFKIEEVTGINIEAVCAEFGDCKVEEEVLKNLEEMGYEPARDMYEKVQNSKDIANIWVALLMKADPGLKLTIVEEEELKDIHFTGYDDKGRHIGSVGYGVF